MARRSDATSPTGCSASASPNPLLRWPRTGFTAEGEAIMVRSERPLASIMAAAAFSLAAPAQAQTVPASAPDRYAMPATAVWDMTSEAGRTYRLFVSFPSQGESPERGYPVLSIGRASCRERVCPYVLISVVAV